VVLVGGLVGVVLSSASTMYEFVHGDRFS
jgi:hypothetical protein